MSNDVQDEIDVAGGEPQREPGHDHDDDAVLPWHRSMLNLCVLALALVVLAGGIGFVIGNNSAIDDPNATDIGFLQDMRYHHEQAVEMALLYLNTPDSDPSLRTIAREIIVGQQLEIGRMIQLLRDFGESEVNTDDIAMSWMGETVALDRMPGLATDADLARLRDSSGREADEFFVTLMNAHHQGGIHMAEHTAEHAAVDEVATMAASMAKHQREEIAEMNGLLAAGA